VASSRLSPQATPSPKSPQPKSPQPRVDVRGFRLALPGIFWMAIFFLLPLLFVLIASFMSRGRGGVPALPPTVANFERTFGVFLPVVLRSLRVALFSTLLCLLLGYPLAFFISTRERARSRQLALFFILLPFWTNLLVRTYAIQTILGREGTINSALMSLGIIQEPLMMLNTAGAVLVGLVYTYLPFMVLPIYAAVERLDRRYVEAAYDLGANDWHAFWRVIVPLTMPGVVAGCTLVFIPAIGSFITPDLLGGTRGLMIGNLIQRQFSGNGNIPLGSAVSVVLMVVVLIGAIVNIRFGEGRSS
jgi:spermidine/putrescine transport system permease protein